MLQVSQSSIVSAFTCLGTKCPDTCCAGWQMYVDTDRRARYDRQAPELVALVDPDSHTMRRHADGHCVALADHLCSIQSRYGTDFVGDACHFYPRVLQRHGDTVSMHASLSCPETLRLLLTLDAPLAMHPTTLERQPRIREIKVSDDTRMQAMRIASDETISVTRSVADLLALAYDSPLPKPEARPADAPKLLYALVVLLARSDHYRSKRLQEVIAVMEAALDCRIDWQARSITPGAETLQAIASLDVVWNLHNETECTPILRRYLQAQCALTAFPFGGLADASPRENAMLFAVRFATVRLALQCHRLLSGEKLTLDDNVRIIGSISRLLDHLHDAELSRLIYRDAGWDNLARLRGLVGDTTIEAATTPDLTRQLA